MPEHTHRCPSPRCAVQVPRRHFACRDHWRVLPAKHQDAITSAERGGREHARAMISAMRWLREQHLQAVGFEPVSDEQRVTNLATTLTYL